MKGIGARSPLSVNAVKAAYVTCFDANGRDIITFFFLFCGAVEVAGMK